MIVFISNRATTPSSPAALLEVTETFTIATNGETAVGSISFSPRDGTIVRLDVNGTLYRRDVSWTLSNSGDVVWLDAPRTLDQNDEVTLFYKR